MVQLDCFSTVKSKERVRFPGFALSGTKSVQISVKTQKALAPNCNHLLRYCLGFNSDVLHSNQVPDKMVSLLAHTIWSMTLLYTFLLDVSRECVSMGAVATPRNTMNLQIFGTSTFAPADFEAFSAMGTHLF
mgnify:CR=1 FL=1